MNWFALAFRAYKRKANQILIGLPGFWGWSMCCRAACTVILRKQLSGIGPFTVLSGGRTRCGVEERG